MLLLHIGGRCGHVSVPWLLQSVEMAFVNNIGHLFSAFFTLWPIYCTYPNLRSCVICATITHLKLLELENEILIGAIRWVHLLWTLSWAFKNCVGVRSYNENHTSKLVNLIEEHERGHMRSYMDVLWILKVKIIDNIWWLSFQFVH